MYSWSHFLKIYRFEVHLTRELTILPKREVEKSLITLSVLIESLTESQTESLDWKLKKKQDLEKNNHNYSHLDSNVSKYFSFFF